MLEQPCISKGVHFTKRNYPSTQAYLPLCQAAQAPCSPWSSPPVVSCQACSVPTWSNFQSIAIHIKKDGFYPSMVDKKAVKGVVERQRGVESFCNWGLVTLKQEILSTENKKSCRLKEEIFSTERRNVFFFCLWKLTLASKGLITW